MTFVVGIDSGGTHSNIRVLTPDGDQKTIPEFDKSLSSNRSDAELADLLDKIVAAIHSHAQGAPTAVWINSAGYSAASRQRLTRLLEEAIKELPIRVGICNDAVGLLLARESEIVTIVAGTGSVAEARTPSGSVIRRGGDEWVVSDSGSAFWLGLKGIRAAYIAAEGGPDTALSRCLVDQFAPFPNAGAERDIREAIQEIGRSLASVGTATKAAIASFAPQVTRQAELGDDEAQKIVRLEAQDLAGAAARVYRALAGEAEQRVVIPRFLISGSVAYRSPFYFEAFKSSLDQFLFDIRENLNRPLEVTQQLNGLEEALILAQRLANQETIPVLDEHHSYSVVGVDTLSGSPA